MNNENVKSNIVEKIVSGGQERITSKELSKLFRVKDSVVRKAVNVARRNGIPICSSPKGYYYSECNEDIIQTIKSLKHRITDIQGAVDGLQQSLEV